MDNYFFITAKRLRTRSCFCEGGYESCNITRVLLLPYVEGKVDKNNKAFLHECKTAYCVDDTMVSDLLHNQLKFY